MLLPLSDPAVAVCGDIVLLTTTRSGQGRVREDAASSEPLTASIAVDPQMPTERSGGMAAICQSVYCTYC